MCSCETNGIDWTSIGTLIVGEIVFVFGIIQWKANNKQSRQQLRAYTSLSGNNAVEVDSISVAGEPMDRVNVSVGLMNTGQTPASRLIIRDAQLSSEVEDPNFPSLTVWGAPDIVFKHEPPMKIQIKTLLGIAAIVLGIISTLKGNWPGIVASVLTAVIWIDTLFEDRKKTKKSKN